MLIYASPMALALAAGVVAFAASHRLDRRVVDAVEVGNPRSEAAHGYAGQDVTTGVANGKPFRQTRGWLHYTLATYDDTQVSIACTFVDDGSATADRPRAVDIVVEDSVIATRTVTVTSRATAVVEIDVPFAVTKGKTNIVVIVRARGGITPALRELRTIQDHHEVDLSLKLSGVFR